MKKIIVTGASGLVGSYLVTALCQTDEVHALSRNRIEPISQNTICHTIDLDGEVDYSSLPKNADALIYLAQSDHFRDFPAKAPEIFQVNTAQVLKALDFARSTGIKTFVYASSGGVYGFPEKGVSEDVAIPASGNLGFYLSTKLCAEILAENYAPYMNIVMLRFFFVYGAGQKRSMLIPRLIDNIRDGKAIILQGEDGIRINPVHVSDAVRTIQASLNLKGCYRINVAGPDVMSLREICNIIGDKVGIKPRYQINTVGAPGNLIAEIDSMKKLLAIPLRRFDEGVVDLVITQNMRKDERTN